MILTSQCQQFTEQQKKSVLKLSQFWFGNQLVSSVASYIIRGISNFDFEETNFGRHVKNLYF